MIYLAIDTTCSTLTIVLRNGEQLLYREKKMEKTEHSSSLMPAIDDIMNEAKLNPKDLEYVATNVGPGSFTGIRIGVASITALSYVNKAKRISFSTFELISLGREKGEVQVDAGHGNTYVALCEDGKILNTSFIEAASDKDLSNIPSDSLNKTYLSIDKIVSRKINNKEFVEVLEPFYMRKSQAERNVE